MDRLAVLLGDLVMRQVRMEIQRRNVVEESQLVDVPEGRKRRDLIRVCDQRRTESVDIVHRNIQRLHQRASILPKALLAGHQRVAVMEVFHLPLLQIACEADVVMRCEQQAGPFALEPMANGGDFLRCGLLFGKKVV